MWLYLKLLIPKLKIEKDEDEDENILESIDMDSYRLSREGKKKIDLDDTIGELDPVPVSEGVGQSEDEYDTLENILKLFNERFGDIDWKEFDKAQDILVKEIPNSLKADKSILQTIANSSRQNGKDASDKKVKEIMQKFIVANTEIFKTYVDNKESFQNRYNEYIFDILFEESKKMMIGSYGDGINNSYGGDMAAQPHPPYGE